MQRIHAVLVLGSIDTMHNLGLVSVGELCSVCGPVLYLPECCAADTRRAPPPHCPPEMVTKAKHLQFVSGVGITVFWLSNLVWDYLSFLIPACGMLLTLLAFQEEGFIEAETQGTHSHG